MCKRLLSRISVCQYLINYPRVGLPLASLGRSSRAGNGTSFAQKQVNITSSFTPTCCPSSRIAVLSCVMKIPLLPQCDDTLREDAESGRTGLAGTLHGPPLLREIWGPSANSSRQLTLKCLFLLGKGAKTLQSLPPVIPS